MRETGLSAIDARDLGAHQFYFVRHTDEAHSHMHIAVNLVHPQTGQDQQLLEGSRRSRCLGE